MWIQISALALAITGACVAQTNGGLSGFGMMGQAMSGMGQGGPVVGPDGTVYAIRQTAGGMGMMGAVTKGKTELVAVDPKDGSLRWTLQLDGYMFSEPVLTPDGNIVLTDSEPGMTFDWWNGMWGTSSRGDTGQHSRLLIINVSVNMARVAAQLEIDADMLSRPVVAVDSTGNYVIYVNSFDMGGQGGMMTGGSYGGDRNLYAFLPDGTVKFQVKLGQFLTP
jgi:outer membrane protein assembly factor BamB